LIHVYKVFLLILQSLDESVLGCRLLLPLPRQHNQKSPLHSLRARSAKFESYHDHV
jgi:hypothetical protein